MEHLAYHHPPGSAGQADMPDEFREILIHQMLANGEGELSAGDTYVDSFYPLAPNADERYICVKFAAEEVDHFRRFSRLLAEMGIDTSHMLGQDKKERRFFAAESMTTDFNTWEERAAFSFLCELEGHYQIKEMVDSPYRPLAIEAREILKEEAMHFAHGALLMRRARDKPESSHRAQQALDKMYPMALDMFGKSDSRRSRLAVKWGLRTCTNHELREIYQRDIDQHITRLGYRVPDASAGRKYF